MSHRVWKRSVVGALTLGILFMIAGEISAQRANPGDSVPTMRSLMRALASAFPMSLHQEDFRHPANRRAILLALEVLQENSEALESHGSDDSSSFHFLRKTLARDTRSAADSYREGRFEVARVFLHQMTENCFACHTRLPGQANKTFGKQFMEDMELESLTLDNRARIEVITRRFDDALTTYEAMLQLPVWEEPLLGFDGAFENYLKVSMRVRNDYEHPVDVLTSFGARNDIPRYMTQPVRDWVVALNKLQSTNYPEDKLEHARRLIQEGQTRKLFPGDRQGTVHFVAASSVLHQFVQSANATKDELAEAYFLLGVVESHISSTSWVSETEFFLENSIRLNPTATFAPRAYAVLEEFVLMQHGALPAIPPEILDYLEELKGLIDR